MNKLSVGLIGCGVISDSYLKTFRKFDIIDVVACASLDQDESRRKAQQYSIPRACEPQDIINDASINCVLNLTVPAVHAEISLAAIKAGKHVYSEKPFVTGIEDGKKLIRLARDKGLYIGNAPDTFLGGRWQTCIKLIEQGVIGEPTGVAAFVGTHGVERHHPNPDFYYQPGAGPMFDLGPYYLTVMIALLGPVKRTFGFSRRTFDQRMIESRPRYGQMIAVNVDTHVCGLLEFSCGVVGSITASFDIWDSETPRLEVYGEKGTICIPDADPVHGANLFQGDVWYRTRETARWNYQPRVPNLEHWQHAENVHGYNEDCRGLGLVDLAYAVRNQRPPRASGEMAFHVFEIMSGMLGSSEAGRCQVLESTCLKPEPLPVDFPLSEP